MDVDKAPPSSPPPPPPRATTADADSPPFDPRYRALSPTSSEPPLFSSDDPPEEADIDNYKSHRDKRKRVGPWFEPSQPAPETKRAKMTRNFDSGVYMMSDGTDNSEEFALSRLSPFPFEGFVGFVETSIPREAKERKLQQILELVERNESTYIFSGIGMEDSDLHQIGNIQHVIRAPPDPGVDVPVEGQYRSMVPELYLNLARNKLFRLAPPLFDIQYLTTLVLRENQIEELPPQINQLRNLRELDLSLNYLKWFPCEILPMLSEMGGELERLQLVGNPLLEKVEWNHSEDLDLREPFKVQTNESYLTDLYESLADNSHPMPFRVAWRIRYLEIQLGTDLKTYPSIPCFNWKPGPYRAARTPVTYYSQRGQIVKGSPALPTSNEDLSNVMADTDKGIYGGPTNWFEPSTRSKVHSLAVVNIHNALANTDIPDIKAKLGDDIPIETEMILERAEENMNCVFSHFRKCASCHKPYVVARAEWFEFHAIATARMYPIKFQVCSWGCVPDEIARKPAKVLCKGP